MCIEVYDGVMSRTNIDISDALLAKAMQRYQLRTKREAVELALQRLVGETASREEALSMEGSGWEGDLDALRRSRVDIWGSD